MTPAPLLLHTTAALAEWRESQSMAPRTMSRCQSRPGGGLPFWSVVSARRARTPQSMMSTRRRSATRQAMSCGSRIAGRVPATEPLNEELLRLDVTSYTTADSAGDLDIAGGRLADLLAAVAARVPTGTRVDVYAHSQEGWSCSSCSPISPTTIRPRLARLGVVVTLASPFHGAELAGLAQAVARPPIGTPLLNAVGGLAGTDLRVDDPAIVQLAPGSDLVAADSRPKGCRVGRGSYRSWRRVTPWCRHRMRISMAPPTSSSP